MAAPAISASAGPITAGGTVGNINSHNNINNNLNIYYWHPGQQRVELANWVSDLDFSQYQSQAYERYTEGTLLWVLEKREFVAWLSSGGILWCPGKPGAGKTVFASFIIHHLQNLRGNPSPTVCYIYCRYHTSRSALQLFEAVLKQLILRCRFAEVDRVQAAKDQGQRLTLMEILSILQEIFDHVPNIFLVIDAFDECFDEATRHQVLHHLQLLESVNTMITSRPLPSIEGAIGSAHRLVILAQGVDIRTHFRAQTKINSRLAKLVPKVSDKDIEGKLVEKADGRFLLAGLHITNLAAQTSISRLLRALDTLPQEVTTSYEETLDRIRRQDPNQRRLAFHTFSWILHALRPLTIIELRHALAIADLDCMAEDEDLDDEEFIVSSCAGLVIVNKESQRVTFLHYTVEEFLQQAQTTPDFLSDVEITLHCMKVISFPDMMLGSPNYPLICYAALAWGPLVRRHEQDEDESVFELALSQLRDPVTVGILDNFGTDHELRSYHREYWGWSGASAIHLLAGYGLVRTTKVFIARTHTAVNEKDMQGRTALIWAAGNGHFEVVKELLNHPNVNVNSKDKLGCTPLSYAARHGHLEAVKELLTHHNVEVDSKDESGCTPLSYAAEGHLEVVRELLNHLNVNVNSKDKLGRTPLFYAAEGHLEVVKELMRNNVDVDSKDKSGRTPLSYAAGNGYLLKELLMHQNVDVNSKDQYGRTPLSWASEAGKLEVVKALVTHQNVNVDSKSDSGFTPLSYAAGGGHLEVIKELLTHQNVDINSKDKSGRTPLFWAAWYGRLKVVNELLNHDNVDINSEDKYGCTPLSLMHSGQ